jgi:hypothetical protein
VDQDCGPNFVAPFGIVFRLDQRRAEGGLSVWLKTMLFASGSPKLKSPFLASTSGCRGSVPVEQLANLKLNELNSLPISQRQLELAA